jgi:putative tryptophan/tyrosine transport system substrate-binding protein
MRRLTWQLLFSLCLVSCTPLQPDRIRPGAADAQRLVVLRSSDNPLFEQPIQWFMDTVPGEVAVFTVTDGNASQLVRAVRGRGPALIFALGSSATVLAKTQLSEVPLVFAMVVDYQRLKLEGGRVAGIALETSIRSELSQFKMLLPKMRRVLTFHSEKGAALAARAAREAAALGLELHTVRLSSAADIADAYTKNIRGCDAIWQMNDPVVLTESVFNYLRDRSHEQRIPYLASLSDEFVQAGALASVSVDFTSLGAQAASLANSILAGRAAGDLGVQEPIGAYLAVNMDVAKLLGLDIPPEAMPNINKVISSDVQETRLAEAMKAEEEVAGPAAPEQSAAVDESSAVVESPPVVEAPPPPDQPKREVAAPAKPPERERATRTVVFYDPDANHEALVRITSWFTEFLNQIDPKLRLQPVRGAAAFEKLAKAGEADFAILPESYVRRKQRSGMLTPVLVPSAKGSVHYKKALFAQQDGGRYASIAAAVPGKAGGDVLKSLESIGVDVTGVTIIPVSKDIDALLALVFGQVDAALVVPESLEVIKPIHPGAEESLHKVRETKPILRSPLCALTANVDPAYQERVVAAVRKMSANSAGVRAMRTLGFDAWVPFEAAMLK